MQKIKKIWILVSILVSLPISQTMAETFIVTTNLDPTPTADNCIIDKDNCSLREAIIASNMTAGPNDIILPADNYILEQVGEDDDAMAGDLDILNNDVNIIGDDTRTTIIDAKTIDRIFHIPSENTMQEPNIVNVTIQNLSLTNGSSDVGGGGILITGISGMEASSLVIDQVLFQRNFATNGASGSAILGFGFSENELDITVTNSTIDSNQATNNDNNTFSGAIFLLNTNFSMLNSTISNNTVAGDNAAIGIIGVANSAEINVLIKNSTITNNEATGLGGGIGISQILSFPTINVEIANSILFGNTDSDMMNDAEDDCRISANLPINILVTSLDYNFFGNVADCGIVDAGNDNFDIDPLIGPLNNNGGPTDTHALLLVPDESPAIDNVPLANCLDLEENPLTRDQRGQIRPNPLDGACDSGAYELGTSDLEIAKTVDLSSVEVGSDVTFTLTIENNGPSNNFNVVVSDILPDGFTIQSVNPDAPDCSVVQQTVTCLFDEFQNGDMEVITIVATADEEGAFTNTADISGTEVDPDPDNNSSSVAVQVTPVDPTTTTTTGTGTTTMTTSGTETTTGTATGTISGGSCSLNGAQYPLALLPWLGFAMSILVFSFKRRR